MCARRSDVIKSVCKIMSENTQDPISEIKSCGEALIKISEALEGLSNAEAVQVMSAVATLHGFKF